MITYQREALALLVSTYRAMRRPLNREASNNANLHAFFMSGCEKK